MVLTLRVVAGCVGLSLFAGDVSAQGQALGDAPRVVLDVVEVKAGKEVLRGPEAKPG